MRCTFEEVQTFQTKKQYWYRTSFPLKNFVKKGQTKAKTIDSLEQQEIWIHSIKTKSQCISFPLDTNDTSQIHFQNSTMSVLNHPGLPTIYYSQISIHLWCPKQRNLSSIFTPRSLWSCQQNSDNAHMIMLKDIISLRINFHNHPLLLIFFFLTVNTCKCFLSYL